MGKGKDKARRKARRGLRKRQTPPPQPEPKPEPPVKEDTVAPNPLLEADYRPAELHAMAIMCPEAREKFFATYPYAASLVRKVDHA